MLYIDNFKIRKEKRMKLRKICCIILSAFMIFQQGCENEKKPPAPVEASDENSVTFDDGDYFFANIIADDDQSAEGELSVEEIQGNRMLKFTDSGKSMENKSVQKININALRLLGDENLEKVRRIEFDLYADAVDSLLVTENGESVKAPGWIGGGGGMVDQNEKWYDFAEYSSGEYNFDFSGACHVVFDFLLADSGKRWSSGMKDDAHFIIMRWGLQNHSNTYIDNITFYDTDGKSIPLKKDKPEESTEF